jgi:hypothetical protein
MTYRRPPITIEEYLDAEGHPISYGSRWGAESPPEDTYTVVSHPERFAPLLVVAQALIEHLAGTYQVIVEQTRTGGGRSVTLVPGAGAATMRFDLASPNHPAVRVRAGLASDHWFPDCGCDACDPDILDVIDELESYVFAVVQGRLFERIEGKWLREELPGGWSRQKITDRTARRELKARAKSLPDRWSAWPRRLPTGRHDPTGP